MTYKIILPFLIVILSIGTVNGQRTKSSLNAGEQRHAERSLKNAKYFIEFLDSTVSNTGTDEEKNIYIEAIRRDTISRILYMKFAFHDSFYEIKKCHVLLINLFKKIIKREIISSRKMLNSFAGEVLRKKDSQSKSYLALGYRSSKWAEKTMIMADNTAEKNYSIRIYEYVNSLKRAKYAKRYAILSLIQSRVEIHKRLRIEYKGYQTVENHILKYLPELQKELIPVHRDNYYQLIKKSEYLSLINKPELETIPEYKNYLRKH